MPHNIWNPERADALLNEAAGGNGRVAALLKLALRKPLLSHGAAIRELETLPENAPGWLQDKFNTAAFHEFDPALDPGLAPAITRVRDWITGAVASGEDWTKEDKPRRLLHFRTVDDALRAADKAMMEENARLKHTGMKGENETETVMELEGGFRIVRLLSPAALDRESVEMNHCIGHGGYDEKLRKNTHIYYSLRDAADRPHATMEIEVKGNILRQCKGKQNVPPVETYFPFIRAFVERKKFTLKENPGHTGLWQAPDGAYHSVRRLPEGAAVGENLDISALPDVVLPENMTVKWLTFDGARPPVLPKGLKAGTVRRIWCKNGKFHREDGPACLVTDTATGVTVWETWRRNNRYHRENGPATTSRDAQTGNMLRQEWFRDNKLHRENGPAIVEYDGNTGNVVRKEWLKDDRPFRPFGPVVAVYDPLTGDVTEETWLQNGKEVIIRPKNRPVCASIPPSGPGQP